VTICYAGGVSPSVPKLLDQALALPEDDRLDLASELIASVDGPADSGWDEAWQAELRRREDAARARAEPAPEWSAVRARILSKLATR
jgi:putative addiction module component (TIGR02574 family)